MRRGAKERRAQGRHPLPARAAWRITLALGGHRYAATVEDISAAGIGLTVGEWLEPGAALTVELTNACSLFRCCRAARVVHVRGQRWDRYRVGCQFAAPLSPSELHTLLH
jgi:hypothetical protein